MLTICTWLWGTKYGVHDVAKLGAGLRRHLQEPHRFIVVCETAELASEVREIADGTTLIPDTDAPLLATKGCFARLRMFDPEWQAALSIDERAVCIDLDCVITRQLDPLFYRPEPFMILQGANASNPCPYNGSVWMLRAGYRPDVWSDFSLEAASLCRHYEFPDDQAWLSDNLPGAAGWKVGPQSGVYAFKKPGWPSGDDLPADARIVVFPGWRDPSKFVHLPWIQEHWRV